MPGWWPTSRSARPRRPRRSDPPLKIRTTTKRGNLTMTTTQDRAARADGATSAPAAPPPATAWGPPIAEPGTPGLAALALPTCVLSVFNANIVHVAALDAVVLPLALFYGGTVQLLAGIWELRKNNTFRAVAFCSFGAFWLSFAAYVKFVAPTLPAASAHEATGVFLLSW